MNEFHNVIKQMTDDEVREAILQMLEDESRNDGIVTPDERYTDIDMEYYTTRLSYFISRQVAVNKSVTDPS